MYISNDLIPPLGKYGICNFSPVTRSPCQCDKQFVRCLKNAKTKVANALGKVFFNVAGLTCYKFEYPIKVMKHSCANSNLIIKYHNEPLSFWTSQVNYISIQYSTIWCRISTFYLVKSDQHLIFVWGPKRQAQY